MELMFELRSQDLIPQGSEGGRIGQHKMSLVLVISIWDSLML